MEFNKKQPALLYLDKNGFYFYEEGLPSIVSLAFGDSVIKDMDVINPASLEVQIKSFVEQYKLIPGVITIILSPNVAFEKDITGLSKDDQTKAVQNFVDTIPFDSVISRTYPVDKGVKIIGFNEDLYLELKKSFERASFGIDSIIPYQLLGIDQTLIKNLTTDTATQLLKQVGTYRQQTLLTVAKPVITNPTSTSSMTSVSSQTSSAEPPKKNTRLFIMIGVFTVLFSILGYMLITML